MGTLASNRKGFITGASSGSYSAALNATTGTASDSATNSTTAIQYFKNTGRGGGTFRFIRTFIHFDTSGITGGSSFQLQLTSAGANGNPSSLSNTTAIKHTAGSSNGGELANADFNNIDRNTTYSSATTFGSSGTVTFTLNATAASQIINNNDFNVALLLSHDAGAEEEDMLEESGDVTNQINFGSAINLTYTDPASGYTHKVNSLAAASIGKVNTVAAASIGKVNTVD
ncbi:hypothetical protein OAV33_00905 [bacterium]|nr:hypothetical protein [bacterium]